MDEQMKNKIADEWKKQRKNDAADQASQLRQPTFSIFLSSLSMQAMIAMGKVENPLDKSLQTNLEQARFLIDTLGIIEEKTVNNLSDEEKTLLQDYLFNLRMTYIETQKNNG
jgi:uncharacterized membrane protein